METTGPKIWHPGYEAGISYSLESHASVNLLNLLMVRAQALLKGRSALALKRLVIK